MFMLIVMSCKDAETQNLKLIFEIDLVLELHYLFNNTNSLATTSVIKRLFPSLSS
jgi:hypothetical protein